MPSLTNDEAIVRLVGALLLEQNDEWTVQRARYMTLETIAPMGCRHQPARRGILIKQARIRKHGNDQRQRYHSNGWHRGAVKDITLQSREG
jgi:hypothetical protein